MKRIILFAALLAACGASPDAAQRKVFEPFPTERQMETQCRFLLVGNSGAPALVTVKGDSDQAGYAYFGRETVRLVPPAPVEFGDTLSARYDVFDYRGLQPYDDFVVALEATRQSDGTYAGALEMEGVSEPVGVVGRCVD